MIIKLNNTQMESIQAMEHGKMKPLVVDGEEWLFIDELDEYICEDGKYIDYIFRQNSTEKYFKITLFYSRYGYDDYNYEPSMQTNEAVEVERKPVTIINWLPVID